MCTRDQASSDYAITCESFIPGEKKLTRVLNLLAVSLFGVNTGKHVADPEQKKGANADVDPDALTEP